MAAERTTKTSDPQPELEERMALVKCPECSGDVSDKATACPHCGNPTRSAGRVQIIEKTGRVWKAIRLLGWLLVTGGVLMLRASPATHAADARRFGWLIAGAGVACIVTSKAGAWWYHG